jgi:hypothetical protein
MLCALTDKDPDIRSIRACRYGDIPVLLAVMMTSGF